jgi:FkbH-like protein
VDAALSAGVPTLNSRDMRLLTRYAKQVPRQALSDRAKGLAAIGSPASEWLRAALLTEAGCAEDAARILHSIDDSDWEEARALRLLALAGANIRAGRPKEASLALRGAAQAAGTGETLREVDSVLMQMGGGETACREARRVAVLGGGTLDLWTPLLRPALYAHGVACRTFTGGYEQYRNELLDPHSRLTEFAPQIVVLAVPWRSLGLPDESPRPEEECRAMLESFASLWRIAQDRFGATVIQTNFEIPEVDPMGRLSAMLPGGRARVLSKLNLELVERAADSGVLVVDIEQLAGTVGKKVWSRPGDWVAAKQYPSAEAAPVLVRHLAGLVRTSCGLSSKCLVLDLDNTLWGGVIGEDGLTGIRLGGDAEGEAYVEFQKYILGLRRRGVMLAVCSKNNPEDALSVFRSHPETILKEQDFAIFVANWDSKPDNLRRIAASLNIGLDAMVFFDDSPVERGLARRELPEVLVPEVPDDPAEFASVLHRLEAFDTLSLTDEDRTRTEKYRANSERAALSAGMTDLDAYVADLRMRVDLHPFDELNLARIVQLINKTNQFNLTTRRTTAAEASAWMADPDCYAQFMRARDRFGDNGLTGVLVAFRESRVFRVHLWLMSCRILGRNIDRLMFSGLVRFAQGAGAEALVGEYLPSARNDQVRDLYHRLGFELIETRGDGSRLYRFELRPFHAEEVRWCDFRDHFQWPDNPPQPGAEPLAAPLEETIRK